MILGFDGGELTFYLSAPTVCLSVIATGFKATVVL